MKPGILQVYGVSIEIAPFCLSNLNIPIFKFGSLNLSTKTFPLNKPAEILIFKNGYPFFNSISFTSYFLFIIINISQMVCKLY